MLIGKNLTSLQRAIIRGNTLIVKTDKKKASVKLKVKQRDCIIDSKVFMWGEKLVDMRYITHRKTHKLVSIEYDIYSNDNKGEYTYILSYEGKRVYYNSGEYFIVKY